MWAIFTRTRIQAMTRVPVVENSREEYVLEVIADDGSVNAFAAGVGTETFLFEDVFLFAPGIGVGEYGRGLGSGLEMGCFHENWGLGVGWQGEGTGADKILD